MRTTLIATVLLAVPLAAQATGGYLVLAAFSAEDPYDAAAQVLARHHRAEIVRFDPAQVEAVRAQLVARATRHVALVMRPEQVDFPFARRFLQLATEVDADPFVDFAFGYVSGRTADDARALAERGIARQPRSELAKVAMVAGGVDRSVVVQRPTMLRSERLDGLQILCAGEKAFPATGRDVVFLQQQLPTLAGRDAITFAGHGYPREVVGGPTFAELKDLRLDGAVVLNVACYTGVTQRWFEDDWRQGVVRQREVPLDESFCLAVLRTGVVGYTAYVCPRPAGPELETDLAALIADGASLGEARRRDYDKTVLGFLGFGAERLQLAPVADGAKFDPQREAVRDLMLEMATGGVVFGDPACVPFARQDGESPVAITAEPHEGGLRLTAKATLVALYQHCADPTSEWGKTMAMRVHARLPLATIAVGDVVVDELKIGRASQPSRVLWAIEDDHGERYLQLRVNFPRGERMSGALSLKARVVAAADGAGKRRGGEVQRPVERSKDVRSREVVPFLRERAAAREVRVEVLQEALDASAALLGVEGVGAGSLERLAARGSEGFRAVCALLDHGHAHYRTWELLKATWRPGDERHLIALAAGPELPNHASWQVLEGLGCADTPEVRALLLARLGAENDAGLFMATAEGLAHLGVQEAAAPIGAAVLAFRPEWAGVEAHLVAALAAIGGPTAVEQLEQIARDGRAKAGPAALQALDRLDPAAAARVRAGRKQG